MTFPERFSNLPEYAFPRLRALLDGHTPGDETISMSIGEPRHAFPDWVATVVAEHAGEFGRYPPNEGSPELLNAIAGWISRRFSVEVALDRQIMALNGTREGLFNACLALCPERTERGAQPVVLMPNPFYQVYAVAALAAGAQPVYVPATLANGFMPDFAGLDPALLERVEIAYLCSPSNPQGAVASREYLAQVIGLAERYDFHVFADECYSELYCDTPPTGALQVASEMGASTERVVIFNSLSKRSNLAGLRSGFVAGGPETIARIKQLRNYAGAPLPLPLQRVAERIWADEAHVDHNRALYNDKYQLADEIFDGVPGYMPPKAGFFLWLPVEDGEAATLKLWQETGVRVLPGAYLSREADGFNPGKQYIRAAMVAPRDELWRGLIKLRDCIYG
ncbi:MAG: aminotransferase class I/II-fold pyridoxal phosphate-dependent enzyme [Rhodobacteraceae bacterium]|nr:aminotransferase class I/II-fold pyridoxal phosphate-dependent enzyme [Paracoccaceae bacterium]